MSKLIQTITEHSKACLASAPKPLLTNNPSPENPFITIQNSLRNKNPHLSDQDLLIKTMDIMKEQFLQSIAPPAKDDASMISTYSYESVQDDNSNKFPVLAGESLDDSPDPILGDFWDSLTCMIAEKMEKDKGKKKV